MIQGRKFDFPAGSIVAFVKGCVDYEWFKPFMDKGIFFVACKRGTPKLCRVGYRDPKTGKRYAF